MTILIDGYNLLHALGLVSRQMAKGQLERARVRMLDWLVEADEVAGAGVQVVFDALHAPRSGSGEETYHGMQVRYTVGQLADDVIEEMIASEPQPSRMTVVSNDHRIQDAARRRGCVAWSCQAYIDWHISAGRKQPVPPVEDSAKPDAPTAAELEEWLHVFGERR